ncbi:MAG: SMC-Scp complex subunit ScpB [Patescibacteria group bacterium]|nr:SMC-Scp complex subunit ScpB [Patescibacteria group bacterium]
MTDLKSKIESILFAAGRPVKLVELARSLQAEKADVIAAIEQLKQAATESGIVLVEKDEKYQLATRPENAKVVGDFLNAEVREKLTDAAVETLAIIVYKQPISRAEIEAIRGVNSQYILRQLSIRGMIEKEVSSSDGRRYVYSTTLDFLHHMGLKDVKDLPDFEELTKSVTLETPTTPAPEPSSAPAQNLAADEEKSAGQAAPAEGNIPSGNSDFSV